jgi:hypothetical protein
MDNHSLQGDLPQGQPATAPATTPPADGLQDQPSRSLYTLLSVGFAGVIMVNMGLCLLLVWQTRNIRNQLARDRQSIARFQRLEEPLVKDILGKLEAFGLQHRDYQLVLQKYGPLFPRFHPGATGGLPGATSSVPSVLPPGARPTGKN